MSEWKQGKIEPNLEGTKLGELVSNLMKLSQYYEAQASSVAVEIDGLEKRLSSLEGQKKSRKVDPHGRA
jgi:hypothetical protein